MILQDMLDELRVGILHDWSNQQPGTQPSDYLWSDERLIRYIDEAQRKFATQTLCLRDGYTPQVTRVQIFASQTEYTLHPSIIAVISARNEGDRVDLARAGHSALSTYKMPDAYFFDPGSLSQLPPGKVVAYDTDEYLDQDDEGSLQVTHLKVYPKPANPYVRPIKLRVVRRPLYPLTINNLNAVPEIPDDYHMDILDYAAYLALRKVDRDAEDRQRASDFLASFNTHVQECKELTKRKLFTKLQWGFGRNGFSWDWSNGA